MKKLTKSLLTIGTTVFGLGIIGLTEHKISPIIATLMIIFGGSALIVAMLLPSPSKIEGI